jgi:hypothetical protein
MWAWSIWLRLTKSAASLWRGSWSGYGERFLEPTTADAPEEKGTILTDEFMRHVRKAHSKMPARDDRE